MAITKFPHRPELAELIDRKVVRIDIRNRITRAGCKGGFSVNDAWAANHWSRQIDQERPPFPDYA